MRVRVIVNPVSGQPEPILAELARAWADADVEWSVDVTTPERDAAGCVDAIEEGIDVVAVYGGDGTVNAAARALIGRELPLLVLPGGTGNGFAQELELPLELDAAARTLVDPDRCVREVDVNVVGDRVSLLRVGIGADARVIAGAGRESTDRLGFLAYLLQALDHLEQPEVAPYDLRIDDVELERPAIRVLILGSGRLGRGGPSLSRDVRPDDGRLDVMVVRDSGFASLSALGKSLLGSSDPCDLRTLDEDLPYLHVQAKRVSVRATPPQPIQIDGEPVDATEVGVEMRARALPVVTLGARQAPD